MKKNIIVYLLLCIFTSVIISSCSNQSSESSITSSESETITTTTSETVTETTEVTTIEDLRTQDVIDAAWEARLNYCGSGLDSIPIVSEMHNEYGYVFSVDSADYPELAVSVDSIFEGATETVYPHIYRCDNRLISFRCSSGFITLDYLGNELELEDIVSDYSYFMATVQPLLAEQYPEDEAVTDIEFLYYYMTYDSVTLVYTLSVGIDSPDSQWISITLGYREYADLFKPCYLPGDGLLIDYFPTNYDLSADWCFDYYCDGYYYGFFNPIFVMNYNESNYCVALYGLETDNPDEDVRYIYVLYDMDSGVEIASQESDEYVRNTQYILDFVGNNT